MRTTLKCLPSLIVYGWYRWHKLCEGLPAAAAKAHEEIDAEVRWFLTG